MIIYFTSIFIIHSYFHQYSNVMNRFQQWDSIVAGEMLSWCLIVFLTISPDYMALFWREVRYTEPKLYLENWLALSVVNNTCPAAVLCGYVFAICPVDFISCNVLV